MSLIRSISQVVCSWVYSFIPVMPLPIYTKETQQVETKFLGSVENGKKMLVRGKTFNMELHFVDRFCIAVHVKKVPVGSKNDHK